MKRIGERRKSRDRGWRERRKETQSTENFNWQQQSTRSLFRQHCCLIKTLTKMMPTDVLRGKGDRCIPKAMNLRGNKEGHGRKGKGKWCNYILMTNNKNGKSNMSV